MRRVDIYTDGACEGNPGPGGWGAILLLNGERVELSEGYELTTNNRMEIMAVIKALEALVGDYEVTLYTDSRYVVDSIQQGWVHEWKELGWRRKGGKRVPNADLWTRLLGLLEEREVKFEWVRGHAGNTLNERADALSYQAIEAEDKHTDQGYLDQKMLEEVMPSKITEEGQPCRKCGTPVIRRKPKASPKPGQQSYFEYYLFCPQCETRYFIEEARVEIDQGDLFNGPEG